MSITINPHHRGGGTSRQTSTPISSTIRKEQYLTSNHACRYHPKPPRHTTGATKKYLVCYAIEFSNNTRT
ncbi:hypothetical protein, partial [Corynebacterium glyciniphilum]|uniref:hypothetical protein n=1 Tax=Corynebacterium glyciniphilum TaxID=1404244 RepID=UPI003FD56EE2